jgi:hypothetical protein
LWEKVLKGDSNFNPALVSKNPEISDAIAATGNEDWVKAIHEKSMEEAAGHYVGNGADPAAALETAQNPWYNKNYGTYVPPVVKEAAAVKPPPVVNPGKGQPIVGGNPGGMFGNLVGAVNDTRPPEAPATAQDLQASYAEQLAAAQAAQQAAYEQQLAAQQAQYEQQVADQQAARQAEIDRRNAEAQAKKEANNAAWGRANTAAAGMAGSAPAYTRKYGQGSNAGGLLSGVNSVRGNSAAVKAPGPVSGMMKKWME